MLRFITPFNFPLNLVAHKVAPAIAAGCPFVLKPAAKTPIGALIIGEVLAETDLPKGAFSILPCSNDDAALLVEDERLTLLSFTGGLRRLGPEGARRPQEGGARTRRQRGLHRRCRSGADLDDVVERLVFGAFYQSGQSCISVQRILRPRATSTTSCAGSSWLRSASCVPATRRDEKTFIGPMIDEDAARRLEQLDRRGA